MVPSGVASVNVGRAAVSRNAPARLALTLAAAILPSAVVACSRGEPPQWDAGANTSLAATPLTLADGAAPPEEAARDAAPPPPVDAGALPQTRDRPDGGTDAFTERSRALWEAIIQDDPARAMPFFFPVAAYEQVKAIPSPSSDWRRRLVANYVRDIHVLHAQITDTARLERFEVPDGRARWVEPGEEGNKLGYWRVYGTRIDWTDADGKTKAFPVTSLISWRGEWYVVHLSGFK